MAQDFTHLIAEAKSNARLTCSSAEAVGRLLNELRGVA